MSVTISGILISVLGFVVSKFNLPVTTDEVEHFTAIAMQLGGLIIAWYGRWRQGDVTPIGRRK